MMTYVGLMVGQRGRRWHTIKPTHDQRLVKVEDATDVEDSIKLAVVVW